MVKMGRPPIEISIETFEGLCELLCTEEEIAAFFKCSVDTLERWCKRTYGKTFAEVFAQKRMSGKITLRRYQLQLAEKNPTMAIWLGKQWLGQRDAVDVNANVESTMKGLSEEELRSLAKLDTVTKSENST